MIRSLLGQKLPTKAQDLIMKAVSPTNILKILRDYDGANQNGGTVLNSVHEYIYIYILLSYLEVSYAGQGDIYRKC